MDMKCSEARNSLWVPESHPMIQRRVGKTTEEAAELLKVLSRITTQGLAGRDPESGEQNIVSLTDEIADVYAQLDETVSRLGLDTMAIENRRASKRSLMHEWESIFETIPLPKIEIDR